VLHSFASTKNWFFLQLSVYTAFGFKNLTLQRNKRQILLYERKSDPI